MTNLFAQCVICGKSPPIFSKFLGICPSCVKKDEDEVLNFTKNAHRKARDIWNLPPSIPRGDGVECRICANKCIIREGESGFCGIRKNQAGKIVNQAGKGAFLHTYLDALPTNCCNSYFCPGSKERGFYNLASFFYGCNFSCLGCQNDQHRNIGTVEHYTVEKFVKKVQMNPHVACVCFFGGSPEPQLPFAIRAMNKVYKSLENERNIRCCWEWNGSGNEKLVSQAVKLSLETDGNAKFDLKSHSEILSLVFSGVSNRQSFRNFEMCYHKYYSQRSKQPVISATTLLVPGYVDEEQVEGIARFISDLDKSIPYSLLVFHPDSFLSDLPNTPRKQVYTCFEIAQKYLSNVHIGNKHLLY
jgi:pyruvate formate lyase activating enzyme